MRKELNQVSGREAPEERRQQYHQRYDHFKKQGKPFWPDIILEDALVALVVFLGLLVLTVVKGVPLEARADPTNAAYIPRPEWYFMFLFQLFKFFPGYLEWVGVIVVPAIGVLALLLLPFYDRLPRRLPRLRPVALTVGSTVLAGAILLTVFAYTTTPPPLVEVSVPGQAPLRLNATQIAGRQLYNAQCAPCHSLGGTGGTSAPPLDSITTRMDPIFVHIYIEDPQKINPGSTMPAFLKYPDIKTLSHEQVEYIVEYLKLFSEAEEGAGQ